MKKIQLFVLICILILFSSCVYANDLGYVVDTDITAFIDSSPINSYNYRNNTFIIAEDLLNYGFDVVWSESERSLTINRKNKVFAPFVDEFINSKKNAEIGKRLFEIYHTDIKTYLDGELILSYNVGGRTIIGIDYLYKYGICSYDDAKRQYYVDILGMEIENKEQKVNTDDVKTVTEKGIFEEGKLVYGIRNTVRHTRFGDIYKTETGDFKNNKIVTYTDDFMAEHTKTTSYKNGDLVSFCINDDSFKFGIKLNYKNNKDNTTDRYIIATGEKYLTISTLDNEYLNDGFYENGKKINGILYKNGQKLFEGGLLVESVGFDNGFKGFSQYYDKLDAFMIYANGYTDQNGVIYYFDKFDSVYYEGNVVNGVAHGYGKVYNKKNGFESVKEGSYTVYDNNKSYTNAYKNTALIYEGNFKDNLLSGRGALYHNGIKIFEGEFLNNLKNGHGRCFDVTTDKNGMDALVIYYDGNFVNDVWQG